MLSIGGNSLDLEHLHPTLDTPDHGVHWVGDIHQPLHVSFEDDRGGNNIQVNGQCSGNLHATWDKKRFTP